MENNRKTEESTRCHRTDGRSWRCKRAAVDGLKLCDIHHLQGMHRQYKQKVPETLKIQRKCEGLDSRINRKKTKKKKINEDWESALFRVVLKSEARKRSKRGIDIENFRRTVGEEGEEELTRDLPNGLMAITLPTSSPSKSTHSNLVAETNALKRSIQRTFRSKNVEPLTNLKPLQVHDLRFLILNLLPKNIAMKQAKKKKRKSNATGFRDSSAQCAGCFNNKKHDESLHCDALCNHQAFCMKSEAAEKNKIGKILHYHYLICFLLPVLKKLIQDREIELWSEVKREGTKIRVQERDNGSSGSFDCDECKNSIADLHKSCPDCSYTLCLRCCRRGSNDRNDFPTRRKIAKPSSKSACCLDLPRKPNRCLGISCPACRHGLLNLTSIFSVDCINDLVTNAEEIVGCYDLPESLDCSSNCSICYSDGRHLFSPVRSEIRGDNLEHFQKHWGKGEPVVVRDVAAQGSSWDPIEMVCTYLENNIAKSENERNVNCLDWLEIEIGTKELFVGSLNGPLRSNLGHETLRINAWLSSKLFEEHFPSHYSDILRSSPLRQYTSGILNIASGASDTADLGPLVYISYSSGLCEGVTKLRYDSHDAVNILAHASDSPVSTERLDFIRKLLKTLKQNHPIEEGHVEDAELRAMIAKEMRLPQKVTRVSWFSAASSSHVYSDSDSGTDTEVEVVRFLGPCKKQISRRKRTEEVVESCGALWDIFRRQDVPKILEYTRRLSNKKGVHPILDQELYLDSIHKTRLKEEFDVEPWTVEQRVGEALCIPCGCPYQIRDIKSCVNVVINFISPENVATCIDLVDELRVLPLKHKAKSDYCEVKRSAIQSIFTAIKEIRELK